MKKSSMLALPTGRWSEEMVLQMSVPQEHFMPAVASTLPKQLVFPNTTGNYQHSAMSSGDLTTHLSQKPRVDATLYGIYGDSSRFVDARPDQDCSDSSSSGGVGNANMMESRENDLGAQKSGSYQFANVLS